MAGFDTILGWNATAQDHPQDKISRTGKERIIAMVTSTMVFHVGGTVFQMPLVVGAEICVISK